MLRKGKSNFKALNESLSHLKCPQTGGLIAIYQLVGVFKVKLFIIPLELYYVYKENILN